MSGQPDALSSAWTWLGASFALAAIGANIAWLLRETRPNAPNRAVARLLASRHTASIHQIARLVYYIGLPFAALLLGRDALTARLLGLQPFKLVGAREAGEVVAQNWVDWARDAGWAAAAGVTVVAFLLVASWSYRRALTAADFHEARWPLDTSGWIQLREAAYHEAHWAFYRGAPLLALGTEGDGLSRGIWVGLGIVALEAVLNPAWRRGLTSPDLAPAQLTRAALALLSAALFWRTQNLWLALALHFVISWALSTMARATTRAAA